MSTNPGSLLNNLREFRINKKPIMSSSLNPGDQVSSKSTTRKRIIAFTDSDSDCDGAPNANRHKNKKEEKLSPINSKSGDETVIEKESKIKYLISMFENVQAYEVYDILSSVNFILPIAIRKLTEKHQCKRYVDYNTWKNGVTSEHSYGAKRKDQKNGHHSKSSHKGKRRKVNTDGDSDDSGRSTSYKYHRVYDSDEDSDVEITKEVTGEKKRVLGFMQTATANELQLMASCSRKKVDAIIACRPFKDWVDLVQKLQQNKNLSTDLLNAAERVLVTRANMKQLMNKCTALSQQLEKAVKNDVGVKKQPAIMSLSLQLTSYQLVGLSWLSILHAQGVNGILADEMGLGKTVQVISFLAYLKERKIAQNMHLVVVPSSTLENWQNEFEKWCPALNVLLYYGSIEERRNIRIMIAEGKYKEYDVMLTTYTIVGSNPEERKMFRVTPIHYVIFDEAHMLKNMNTRRYESLIRVKAAKRILLTGTPLQNNLLELMSLLIFVMPNIFSEKTEDLKSLFQKTAKGNEGDDENVPQFEKEQVEQAKRIMKPFVLRRLKRDVLKDLPKKTDYMLQVAMAPTQEEQYQQLVKIYKEAGDSDQGKYNGITIMTELRKLSNHPLLLRYHYQNKDLPSIAKKLALDPDYKENIEKHVIEDLGCMSDFEIHTLTKEYPCIRKYGLPDNLILTSGKFLFLDKKLKELKDNGNRVLIFSQYVIMLDVMEEYLKIRNHRFLRLDGSTPVQTRQQLIDEYTSDQEIFVFLLSTRAGGLGINLTSADTVIIHDIDFNPYNDKQAEDRCHRMGQKKPVTVYRLISKGTIEEGMWQLTQEKLKLEKEITGDGDTENTDVKSVVNLLSSALGINSSKATNLVSPKKKL
nr:SWI/SNF-related matrix-associated actin-dependent regulator of chromatin subfamily A containing DEAD/H box 1 homolog [Onthophagus taurus]